MMKDLHNHLLYEIDDGSKSYQNSIELLEKLQNEGVTEIVVTPHYIIGTNYNCNNKKKRELIEKLQNETKIKLYMGNEVYLDYNIIKYIKNGEISTINNSCYLLVELPLNERLECVNEIIFDLRNKGVIPIIAHPERYHYLNLDELIYFIDSGCLLQGNITSLCGKYGKNAQKNLELLLKKHMIHVLGTDIHRGNNVDLKSCYSRLLSLVDKKMMNELLNDNFDKIVRDIKIEPYDIVSVKGLFKREKIR